MASCDNKNELTTNEQGLVDDGGQKLTPDSQKSKIEETANALMTDLDINVWQAEYDMVNGVIDEMGNKEVDASSIEQYLTGIVDAWTSVTGEDPYTTTITLIQLSDIKGHFTENADGGFDFEEGDDLQVTIFSQDKTITATFAAESTDLEVNILEKATVDAYGSTVEATRAYIPSKAVLGLLVDNAPLASLEIRLNPKDLDNNCEFEITDQIDLGYTMKVGAYEFSIDQANYGRSTAALGFSLKRENHLILGLDAKAAIKLEEYNDGYHADVDVIPVSAEATLDIEGKIQFKGNIPDYAKFEEIQARANQAIAEDNFEAYKAEVALLEKSFGVGVYYDGGNTLQATLGFEPFHEDIEPYDYNGDGIIDGQDNKASYGLAPVIRFADGTSYGMVDFYQDEKMENLWNNIGEWVMGIADALGLLNHAHEADPVEE